MTENETDTNETDCINIKVNHIVEDIPVDFGNSPSELIAALGWPNPNQYSVYRMPRGPEALVTENHRCKRPMAVDEWDAFVAVPEVE